jgi:hypothetical protein
LGVTAGDQLTEAPPIYDGDHRIEFVGLHKGSKYSANNMNGYQVYWRLSPQDG